MLFNTTLSLDYVVEDKPEQAIFLLQAILLIPKVSIQPNLEDVQEIVSLAAKHITSVAKGVAQWSSGKPTVIIRTSFYLIPDKAFRNQNNLILLFCFYQCYYYKYL